MKKWILPIFLLASVSVWSQQSATITAPVTVTVSDTSSIANIHNTFLPNYKSRKILIAGIHTAAYTGTLLLLSQAWYKDYPKTAFHTFDDSKEWLQVDKVGHAWTAYNIAKYSTETWEWAGFPHKKAVMLGGLSSLGYQTILETLDAHSAEWGWSWSDMAANAAGVSLYCLQEWGWQEQRIQFKFSSHPSTYSGDVKNRTEDLFGKSFQERLLKDYNSQTYWMSFNLKSFAKQSQLPAWLNIAIGYGAQGLYGGFENTAYGKDGSVTFDRRDIPRLRQWYFSPDIDFTKIKTRKPLVRTMLSLLNMLKMPAPALEFSNGKVKGHFLYF
ncbi:DUF2279 domain-containing protein [Flavisolibacter tropicus]|uniref:DUF2279 domain-containing protein n=1 Tax=Flavisolibacter tropicus TaxID=1492898 RepID=UPI001314026A|nr:DUF2279 domain-containing protein [Flavisolibacter tropicus]